MKCKPPPTGKEYWKLYSFREYEYGPLKIFREPEENMVYTMGTDASTGLAEDYSCIQIFANTIPFEQCAVFHDRMPVNQVSEYVNMIGRWYKTALNVCEINYPGNSIQDSLLQLYKYPRNYQMEEHLDEDPGISAKYGFRTTEQSKWLLINQTQQMIQTGEIIIHDKRTLEEMNNFVYQASKKQAAAAPGFNDDCVMAMMLALHGCKLYPIVRETKVQKVKARLDPDTTRDWKTFRRMLASSNRGKPQGAVL